MSDERKYTEQELQAAVEAERERCIAVVENVSNEAWPFPGAKIVEDLRALGPTTALDAMLAEARDKALVEAAAWLCGFCDNGNVPVAELSGKWIHSFESARSEYCKCPEIHRLRAAKGGG